MRQTLRSAGLGRLAYRLWFQPISRARAIIKAGGPFEVRRTELGRHEMEAAARRLPSLPLTRDSPPLELHLLTGKRFWYQTAFCLWTFGRQSGRHLRPVIYDDGTLDGEHREPLERLFPQARFVAQQEILTWLDAHLPQSRFPILRERWQHYPNIRKLTDVHAGQSGWKLVIDSDLLFFRRPSFLIDWLDQPIRPLHGVDCENSYGYSRLLMNHLAGATVADLVNVGLTGLDSGTLDWEKIEYWCRKLIERERTHYYLEQALVAMLLAGRDCAIAPAADYLTKPSETEALQPLAVMHHYVSDSNKCYLRHCWQAALMK
jgi:hypothetical protein